MIRRFSGSEGWDVGVIVAEGAGDGDATGLSCVVCVARGVLLGSTCTKLVADGVFVVFGLGIANTVAGWLSPTAASVIKMEIITKRPPKINDWRALLLYFCRTR